MEEPSKNHLLDRFVLKKINEFFCKVKNDIHRSNAAKVTIRIEGTKFKHVITIDR